MELSPMKISRRSLGLVLSLGLGLALAGRGRAESVNLITNGDFETGSLSGWTVANQLSATDYAGGTNAFGSFFLQDTSGTLPVSGPLTGGAALLPYSGNFYALADSTAPGAHVLLQSFIVPTEAQQVTLTFAMYTYDWYGNGPTGTTLDYTSIPNQHVRVDILSATAGAFDTSSSAVVENLFNGELPNPPGTNPPAWQAFSFDLTGVTLPGGTYQLRFGEVDNQFTLNMGVDAVSLTAVVPEPPSLLMASLGGAIAAATAAIGLRPRRRIRLPLRYGRHASA
jgi:hypothetical protein